MTSKHDKLADSLTKSVPPAEAASDKQIDAYKQRLEQVDDTVSAKDGRAVVASKLPKVLFTKCLPATIDFNRSASRIDHDYEEGALCAAPPRMLGSGCGARQRRQNGTAHARPVRPGGCDAPRSSHARALS